MRRRTYLTNTTATALGFSIAGCLGSEGTEGPDVDDGASDDGPEGDDSGDELGDDGGEEQEAGDSGVDEDEEEEDELSHLVGTFDDFEDVHAWDVIAGTLEADREFAYEGTQSARVTASESENRARIVRELGAPIDVSDVVPGLALSASRDTSPVIQLHDVDGNYLQFQQFVHADHPFVRRNFGHTAVSGDPNLSEITEIHVDHWTGDEHEGELWVDDLHFVPRVDQGRVMVQFQGGFETDYTKAFPIMEDHGLTGSTFVATSRIRESQAVEGDRMTEDQLAELVNIGWSVGTVGARGLHLYRVDPARVDSDILDPLEWFAERGYDDARYFAFPGGWHDEEAYDLVEENYDLAYAGRFRSQGWASNPYNLTRISGGVDRRNLDADDMIDALDWTAEHGGITTITFYEMDEEDTSALEAMASHLTELESTGDLETITPREIADEYVL